VKKGDILDVRVTLETGPIFGTITGETRCVVQ